MKIAIYGQHHHGNLHPSIHTLLDFLMHKDVTVSVESEFLRHVQLENKGIGTYKDFIGANPLIFKLNMFKKFRFYRYSYIFLQQKIH